MLTERIKPSRFQTSIEQSVGAWYDLVVCACVRAPAPACVWMWVSVRACVRMRVWVCVRVCMRVCAVSERAHESDRGARE